MFDQTLSLLALSTTWSIISVLWLKQKTSIRKGGAHQSGKTMKTKLKLSLSYLRIKINRYWSKWDSSRLFAFMKIFGKYFTLECFLSCRWQVTRRFLWPNRGSWGQLVSQSPSFHPTLMCVSADHSIGYYVPFSSISVWVLLRPPTSFTYGDEGDKASSLNVTAQWCDHPNWGRCRAHSQHDLTKTLVCSPD